MRELPAETDPGRFAERLRAERRQFVADALGPVSLGLTGLYLALVGGHLLLLPAGPDRVMASLAALSVLLYAGLYAARRKRLPPPRWAHPVAFGAIVLALANVVLHLVLLSDPLQSTSVALLMIGAGSLLLSRGWLAAALLTITTAWVAAIARVDAFPELVHVGFMLLMAGLLAVVIHEARLRHSRRLALLGEADERRAYELERAVAQARGSAAEQRATSEALAQMHGVLERRVSERTAALSAANALLLEEVAERHRAEAALRRSEEEFRALIENGADLITIVAADGTVRFESPSVARVLGYAAGALVGQPLADLLPADEPVRERVVGALIDAAANDQSLVLPHRHRDGSWRLLESRCTNLLHNPRVAGLVVNSRDVTERAHLEAQLRQAQKMEALGRLAGGVAHDFNNLLTVIKGNAAVIEADLPADHPASASVREIRRAADHAAALTAQLLALSRRQVLQPVVLDLNAVVTDVHRMLARLLGPTIRIELDLDPALSRVRVDRVQIEQVLINLAVNARDAMEHGGTLRIRTDNVTATDGSGSTAQLTVADTGCGIEPAVMNRLFEPFFTTKPQGKGTGLGLATVYGIIRQSGGETTVHSEPGRGAAFTIRLPGVSAELTPAADAAAQTDADVTDAGGTILLVEDERHVRQLMRRILLRHGFRVEEAASGEEALRLFDPQQGRFAAVLTDVQMPGINGVTLVRELRRIAPGLPAVFMSGYTDDDEGLASDAITRFIQKPFEPNAVAQVLRDLLDRRPADPA